MTQPPLQPCEVLMTDPDEVFYRQVRINDVDVDNGEVRPLAFKTSSNDDGKLSGTRSSKRSAEQAFYDRKTVNPGSTSIGTWGVTVGEVISAGSRCIDDSDCPPPPGSTTPPGHCYIDFRGLDKTERSDLRDDLAFFATTNRRLYPPS
ncbi:MULTISPECIES: hypothetical protein [unclassified Gordonia (in: high G+C Gram-positive bacteria)]|uniref:hypothetical protein n=1 Tax=unclassified Gordonia (in: high G+C Gram-positive bacteria) TaxID=2657482 RepID=UPI0019643105|nr:MULTISPECIES: hypothetical protein [unclassified Gordonia (in: high G+C Gram-positive bacteria)]MBN0975440.1 hypothetical protein [Gordonia sp. BP-119]MBN0985587.1 hypothetical protein [Gordonia sp. BP-94]